MSDAYVSAAAGARSVGAAIEDTRAAFIVRTYAHLLGAVVAFTLLELYLFSSGAAEDIARRMLAMDWLGVLGAFVLVSWLASSVAHSAAGRAAQYFALGAYVAAEAVIFVPLLYLVETHAPGVLESGVVVTLVGFGGLTAIVFLTRADFSFLGGLLSWVGFLALAVIVSSLLLDVPLGAWFATAMVALSGAAILHATSNVVGHFPEDRHVAAALELFASVALMFWYVLNLVDE